MKLTVLITGASRGIGQAIAIAFAKAGYQLVITCSKTEQDLLELADILKNHYGAKVLTSIGDISDYDYVSQLFQTIEATFGGVDVLINNAGISYVGLLTDMSIDDWNRKNYQYFFRMGDCRSLLRSCLLGLQGWYEYLHKSFSQRAGTKQYTGKRYRMRMHRYTNERLLFR